MNKFHFSIVIAFVSILFSGCQQTESPNLKILDPSIQTETTAEWKEVKPGLLYTDLHIKNEDESFKDLLLVRIDPKKYSFSIYQNQPGEESKTIDEIYEETDALLAFNGQFFTEEFNPTGLSISQTQLLNEKSNADLVNGIMVIDNRREARLLHNQEGFPIGTIDFAIQNGPILLDENGNPSIIEDSGKTASRTALGIDQEGNLVVIVLKQSLLNFENSITLYQFAQLLASHPEIQKLGLHSVLNLDGGTSSGIAIDHKYYPEMEKVQSVVLVKAR
ncbi:MAG TPA: phosphodiester glycosidase family protein [Candidatus Gracilibacteria bacterium]|nr:phosphodiester glycosidase family protein [Candidatus Gracilibacteria bacterium]